LPATVELACGLRLTPTSVPQTTLFSGPFASFSTRRRSHRAPAARCAGAVLGARRAPAHLAPL